MKPQPNQSAWKTGKRSRDPAGYTRLVVEDWINRAETLPYLNFIPVDNRTAVRSITLPGTLHRDPADRIIIASALALEVSIVTRAEKIKRYRHVKTVW